MRIVSDIMKADAMITLRSIEVLDGLKEKYRIIGDDDAASASLTLSDAVNSLKEMPLGLLRHVLDDLHVLASYDTVFGKGREYVLFAVFACLSGQMSDSAEMYSTALPDGVSLDKSQILYVEGEFDAEANRGISMCYREILAELRLIGLDFVYLPELAKHIKSWPQIKFMSFMSFLYPGMPSNSIRNMAEKLVQLKTSDFNSEVIVRKIGLKELDASIPSLLLCVNESKAGGRVFANFLSVTLDREPVNTVRNMVDMFVKLYGSKTFNYKLGAYCRFTYNGYYKSALDMLAENRSVRSRVVIAPSRGEISLPEAGIKLSGLLRKEKALYALFLFETAGGGINFGKPENAKALARYNRRMSVIQARYDIVYEAFGGSRLSAPKIFMAENRSPMLSHIKRQFCLLSDALDGWEDYTVRRNVFGNYCVSIPSCLCFCVDTMTMETVRLEDTSLYCKLYSL